MYTVCVYIYRNHALVEAHLQYVHDSYGNRSREKGTPLRKCTNKDKFSCLNTIWSIGIARRGLNELKTWNLTKIYIFHFFVSVAQNEPVRNLCHI